LKTLEKTKNKPVILAGDLNVAANEIDIYDPTGKHKVAGYTPEERHGFTQLLNNGFVDTFRQLYPNKVQYTFWSTRGRMRPSNRGWRLDYFMVSQSLFPMV
jgi:exodeoxyribonuclease-3